MGHTFASKLGQMPHLFPTIAREGVVGHNVDRCISTILYKVSSSRKISHNAKLVAVTGNNNFSSIIGE